VKSTSYLKICDGFLDCSTCGVKFLNRDSNTRAFEMRTSLRRNIENHGRRKDLFQGGPKVVKFDFYPLVMTNRCL